MHSDAKSARRAAAEFATRAQEADEKDEREFFLRLRDAWTGMANRCEFLDLIDDDDATAALPQARDAPLIKHK